MSAFYDVWISNNKNVPSYSRMGNNAWSDSKSKEYNYSLSFPHNATIQWFNELNTETHHLIVLGQFYEAVEYKDLLDGCVSYVSGKSQIFNDPAGHYIIFLFDKVKKLHYIFTDRMGTYHAYHSSENGINTISTFYLGLAKQSISKTLDWEAISGFFAMGFFPEDTTYLKTVKIFKPAACYSFNENLEMVEYRRYWNWTHIPTTESLADNIDRLHQVLKDSLSYPLENKRVAIPISGGLDSRTLAGVIDDIHSASSVWGYSYGYSKKSIETRIAKKIAAARHIPFNDYVVPDYLFNNIDVIAESVDLFQYIDGTRQACMLDMLENKSDEVIGGHWGDVWLDNMGVSRDNQTGTDEEILLSAFNKKIIKKGSDWLLNEVCQEHVPDSRSFISEYFKRFVKQYDYIDDIDFRMKIFKTDQWSFRWTLASLRMYQAAVMPVLPFYDKRVVELFITIPTSQVSGRNMQIEYLKKYHPDLARIKWQEYHSNLYNYKLLNNRNIIYRVIDKTRRTLKRGTVIRRNWELFYLNAEGKKNLEAILLDNKSFNQVVSRDKVRKLLDDFYKNPSAGNGYAISMLHTFAQFLRKISD